MNSFNKAWNWLSIEINQKSLGVIFLVIAGGWQAYLHFSKKTTEPEPTIVVSGNGIANKGTITATASNGNATNIVGNHNTVGMTYAEAERFANNLLKPFQLDNQAKAAQIKALTEAVTALSKDQGILGTEAQVKAALATLAKGDTSEAKALFAKAAKQGEQDDKQTAEAYRNLGALAFLDNTQEALDAYRHATELDPDDTDGWNQLRHLLGRNGTSDRVNPLSNLVLSKDEEHPDQLKATSIYGNMISTEQNNSFITKTIDTGSHTCTKIGQEEKAYHVAESGSDRFFLENTVRYDEVSKLGGGGCDFTNDAGSSVERRDVTLKLANGMDVKVSVPVKYYLRAFGDCGNNPGNIGKSMGTECVFSGETSEYQ